MIAIIAILAAILFPVFARAREKARQTTCTSNQRQIAATVAMYAQDHEETLPQAMSFWQDVKIDPGVLICPTAGKSVVNGYAVNGSVCGLSMGTFNDPTTKPLTFDGLTVSADPLNTTKYPNIATWITDYDFRHSGSLIASYVDGHVAVKAGTWNSPTFISGTFPDRLNPLHVLDFEDGLVPLSPGWGAGGGAGTTGAVSVVAESASNKVCQFRVTDNNYGYSGGWDLRFNGSFDSNNNGYAKRVMEITNSDPAKVRPVTTLCSFRIKMVSETINNAGNQGALSFGPYIGLYRQFNSNWEFPQYITQSYSGRLPQYTWWTDSRTSNKWVSVDCNVHSQTYDPIMNFVVKPVGTSAGCNYTRLDYGWVMQGYYRSDTVWIDDVVLSEIQPG